jgi:hypothetical protein
MIQGNQTWTQALGQPAKQPLYCLVIPAFGMYLTSFLPSLLAQSGAGGWGVTLWGVGGWGT